MQNFVRWSILAPSYLENSKSYNKYVAILQTGTVQMISMEKELHTNPTLDPLYLGNGKRHKQNT